MERHNSGARRADSGMGSSAPKSNLHTVVEPRKKKHPTSAMYSTALAILRDRYLSEFKQIFQDVKDGKL